MRNFALVLTPFVLLACHTKDLPDTSSTADDSELPVIDEDADGYDAETDCDDNNAAVHPEALELCDTLDNDCDGEVDDGAGSTWYTDQDQDGYGVEPGTLSCEPPPGSSEQSRDCDDSDPSYYPGASEADCSDPNDYNCDGSVGFADNDSDGYAACEDCDDSDASVNPGGVEICDSRDNNCDSTVDEGVLHTYYSDTDGDSFGDPDYPTEGCSVPSGYSTEEGDCDDTDAAVNPDASEVCDQIDNDCDTLIDDADDSLDSSGGGPWYDDVDGDGYGDSSSAVSTCAQPSGTSGVDGDCDDSDAAINPNASEVCDEIDNDCDSLIDDDDSDLDLSSAESWYVDDDGDGYGSSSTVTACTQPSGSSTEGGDCDDTDSSSSPAGTEVCDTTDNDCDGSTDEDLISYSVSTTSPSGSCSGSSNWQVTISACGCSDVVIAGAFVDYSDGAAGQVVSTSVSSSSASAVWDDCSSGCDCDLDISTSTSWTVSRSAGSLSVTVSNSITGYEAGNSLGAGYSITGSSSVLAASGSSSTTYTYTCSY